MHHILAGTNQAGILSWTSGVKGKVEEAIE
jgi:hypothetical protein